MTPSNSPCPPHSFTHSGVKFRHTYSLPGGSAKRREYFDSYFCSKCLEVKLIPLEHLGDTSYDAVKYGATPVPEGSKV